MLAGGGVVLETCFRLVFSMAVVLLSLNNQESDLFRACDHSVKNLVKTQQMSTMKDLTSYYLYCAVARFLKLDKSVGLNCALSCILDFKL